MENGDPLVWAVFGAGARCEETFLVNPGGTQLLTNSETWPQRSVPIGDRVYELPDLLLT